MQFNQALRHNIVWKVVNTFFTFFINLLLVRLLGAAQSGVFYYDVALLGLLVLLQGFSLESGIVYLGSKDKNTLPAIFFTVSAWLLVQVLLSAFILSMVHTSISKAAAVFFVCANIAVTYLTALFAANKNFITPNIIAAFVNFILLAALFVYHNTVAYEKAPGFILSPVQLYIYSFVLQALLLLIFFLKNYKKQTTPLNITGIAKALLRFSAIACISNILFFLLTRIDYYFVSKYCTTQALGNYIQVSKFGQLLILLPSMIAAVIFPYTASEKDEMILERTQFFCRIITWLFISVILAIAATGFWLFPALFGDGFDQMYTTMLFYLPGFFALSIITVLAAYTGGKGMVITNLSASAIALIVVIAGDILLIPLCGINGAAIASSLAYFICMMYLLWQLKHKEYFFTTDFFGLKLSDLKRLVSV